MRIVLRLIVLGFAGLGVYKTWEVLGPKVAEARQRAVGARETIEPAIREAAETLQTATKDAVDELTVPVATDVASSRPSPPLDAAEHVSPPPRMAT